MIAGRTKNPYAACYDEIDTAISSSCDSTSPVVINFHAYPDEVPDNAILYNFDNVGIHFQPDLLNSRFAFHVANLRLWDFSLKNVNQLFEHAIYARHVPVGYHPSMERFSPLPYEEKDIDVIFAGALNDRRIKVLDALSNRGLHVHHVPDLVYGEKRDALFARSKLALSMMFHEEGAFPALRIAHLVSNQVPVLSEQWPEEWDFVTSCPYDELVDWAEDLVKRPNADLDLAQFAKSAYLGFKSMPLVLPLTERKRSVA